MIWGIGVKAQVKKIWEDKCNLSLGVTRHHLYWIFPDIMMTVLGETAIDMISLYFLVKK
jgi:hypothetical protein